MFICRSCSQMFSEPKTVDYGAELWESLDCCPRCYSEDFYKKIGEESKDDKCIG